MATYGGFVLTSAKPFASYHGYISTGKRGSSNTFALQGAITHNFFKLPFPCFDKTFVQDSIKDSTAEEISLYPPTYHFDISFWVDNCFADKGDELAKLQSVSSGVFGETVQSISFLQSYTNSENRLSHSFRFHVCSKFFALSPVQFKILEKKFRILLAKSTSVEVR